jgi:prolyl oligopeptidase
MKKLNLFICPIFDGGVRPKAGRGPLRRGLSGIAAIIAFTGLALAQTPGDDPFRWLEDIHGARALAWVAQQNARTAAVLETDPRYELFRREALAIFTAKDRIPYPDFLADGLDNLWQDGDHPHGLWRRTSFASYATPTPQWDVMLDLDQLSSTEGKSWFWKGATCLRPAERYCLVRLSNGGGDAVRVREFDTLAKRFVAGGFDFAVGKQYVAWLDRNTLIVGRDWSGSGADLTASGYPYVLKIVKRGQPVDEAKTIFRGAPTDVWAQPRVLFAPDGAVRAILIEKGLSFFEQDFYLLTDTGPVKLPFPPKTTLQAFVRDRLTFTIQQDWAGFKAGALLAYDLADLKAAPATARPTLILQPSPTQAIDAVHATRNRLILQLLDNVQGAIEVYDLKDGAWTHRRLALPEESALAVRAASDDSDRLFVTSEGFLDPTTLWAADAATGAVEKIKALPPRFDASKDRVEQRFAASADGTRIPYFLVAPKTMTPNGATPVQMFGYGGFELSETPAYKPEMGKLWLERGGAYVVANIRGGGEFGPAWHDAALREHRQRAFDDFAAVAKDLIATGVTSPRRLGIYGRSNGGVLMSVSMTQHPELFGAVVIESPLIDMLRYNHLSAGASWVGEYGDPDVPADRAFIAKYSAYQRLKAGVKYPEPYITTNTEDDRVHPSHARKFAAKLESLGDPYLYYENTFGGHANDADPELNARRWARHYVYLSQKLMN